MRKFTPVAMPRQVPNGRERALESAVNERFVRCGADRNPAREKMRRAVGPAIADVVRFPYFFVVNRCKWLKNSGLLKKRSREIGKMWRLLNKTFTPIDL